MDKPKLQWETGVYSLEDILQKYPLPRVVQCAYTLNDDISTEKSNFDFLQPMLLYQKRVCNKVTATSLNTDPQTGNTVEVGAPLLIPEDYKGWFAVSSMPKHEPVPQYRLVAKLAASDCHTFLIGGEDEVIALQAFSKTQTQKTRVLYPGDVLTVVNLYVATIKVRKSIFFRTITREETFLLCTDNADRQVLLPIDATGVFYVLKHKTEKLEFPVLQIKDIVADIRLPCVARLLYGHVPVTPCVFTGTLRLSECHHDVSVVTSSVFNQCNILLELPVAIPLMFRVAKPDRSVSDSAQYKYALRQCQEGMETYMRSIKVSQEPASHTDCDTFPVYDNVPPPLPPRTRTGPPDVLPKPTGRTQTQTTPEACCPDSSNRDADYIQMWFNPQAPPTPSKCENFRDLPSVPKTTARQSSITISTTNDYLTMQRFPQDAAVDTDLQVASLVDKINLWQRRIISRQGGSSSGSLNGATITRPDDFTYSEIGGHAGMSGATNRPARRQETGTVYENIETLRQLRN
ncbi:uncharacterized protein [Haliotis cracherodii]|uniref:uncharacterized protein n=1 Tax=Haliotis cracherodii TaxID=6455 RepID=UPI0039ED7448